MDIEHDDCGQANKVALLGVVEEGNQEQSKTCARPHIYSHLQAKPYNCSGIYSVLYNLSRNEERDAPSLMPPRSTDLLPMCVVVHACHRSVAFVHTFINHIARPSSHLSTSASKECSRTQACPA